jgi:hypothetical protein
MQMARSKLTPEEIAEEEKRTTALGLFNRAEVFWLSAHAVEEAKVKHSHAEIPIRYLYYFAIELYLKAFIRDEHTLDDLERKFGHKTTLLSARAEELGIQFCELHKELFSMMGNTDIVIRARYIRTGSVTWPPLETLDAACRHLREDVGRALKERGNHVRI